MITFKAFNQDLTSRLGGKPFQYRLGIWNEEPEANCVKNGFHSATNPLDCLNYYPRWDDSVYYLVQLAGDIDEDGTDSKVSSTKLKLLKRLTLIQFLKFAIAFMADYPNIAVNKHVHMQQSVTDIENHVDNHFVIVRGKEPKAISDELGSYICLVKEQLSSQEITEYSIIKIDGKKYKTGEIYSFQNIDPVDVTLIPTEEKGI
ncbi:MULTISPECIES: DUF7666 domain-containing protein [Clostridia]|uniref:DUF7666 domain-containing protein n=1 Tax=Clostridia TaxID=186801 RepID=UPI00164E64FA|nr:MULTISPECIES: hypothetical protein [Clostridia]